ncbi:Hypothetical_protein [Hexamita inflata]|uniref:Hypothetical_protein n=1 Tax=Hexamita inflata TaxID=28002 RepID=A0ABP1K224_9EUKA
MQLEINNQRQDIYSVSQWRVGFGCSWIQATATPGSTGPARRLRLALPGLATIDVQGLAAPPKIDTPEGPLDLFLPARRLNIEVVNLIKKGCEQKYKQIYSQMRQQVKISKSNLGSRCTQTQIFFHSQKQTGFKSEIYGYNHNMLLYEVQGNYMNFCVSTPNTEMPKPED